MTDSSGRPQWRRRAATFVAAVVVTAGAQFIAVPAASAATCGSISTFFEGYSTGYVNPTPLEGISGNFYDPGGYYLCSGPPAPNPTSDPVYNYSREYVGLLSHAAIGYSQAGVIYRFGYLAPVFFAENKADTGALVYGFSGYSSVGGVNQVWNQMVGAPCPHVWGNVNSTNILQSTWSPHCGGWQWPIAAQVLGQTRYADSNLPGLPNNQASFGSMLVQRYTDTVWVAAAGTAVWASHLHQTAWYGSSAPDGATKNLWSVTVH